MSPGRSVRVSPVGTMLSLVRRPLAQRGKAAFGLADARQVWLSRSQDTVRYAAPAGSGQG